jgi:hypothetical protein
MAADIVAAAAVPVDVAADITIEDIPDISMADNCPLMISQDSGSNIYLGENVSSIRNEGIARKGRNALYLCGTSTSMTIW